MEIKAAIKKIRELGGCPVIFITDHHHKTDGVDRRPHAEAAMYVAKKVGALAIVIGGDYGNDYAGDKEKIAESYRELMQCYCKSSVPVLSVIGNHDDATGIHRTESLGTENCFSPDELHSLLQQQMTGAVFDVENPAGNYFYQDFGNVRIIGLNTSELCFDAETKRYRQDGYTHQEISERQLIWLRELALKTEMDILVFSHSPLRNNGMCGCTVEPLRGGEVWACLTGKRIVGIFSGHTHCDNIHSEDGITALTTSAAYTATENSPVFDCICVGKKSVELIRIGNGENRRYVREGGIE